MREWRRSRINRAAHDLPPGWAGVTLWAPPGRTRTCTLRIRSAPRPVCLVPSWSIAPGRIGSAVRLVASRLGQRQRSDCHRDCHTAGPLHSPGRRWPGQAAVSRNVSTCLFAPERRHWWTAVVGRGVAVASTADAPLYQSGRAHHQGWLFHSPNAAMNQTAARFSCSVVAALRASLLPGWVRAAVTPLPEGRRGWGVSHRGAPCLACERNKQRLDQYGRCAHAGRVRAS